MKPQTRTLLILAASSAYLGLSACSKTPEAPMATAPAASAVVASVSDIDVTTQVKTALLAEPSLKSLDITVVTLQGDVRLTGMLDSQAQIDDALRITRAASGVHSVHDELTLKK